MIGLHSRCFPLSFFAPLEMLLTQSIVINEIHYNPSSSQGSDTEYEFIELYNAGGSSVDVADYYFSGITYTFPSGTSIASGAFTVIARNSDNYSGSVEWTSGVLTNSGETVTLYDGSGNTIDQIAFDKVSPWPTPPDGDGPSLELKDASSDNSVGANWTYSYHSDGTPGYANQSFRLTGSAGWRTLTLPLKSKTYDDLLSSLWTQGFTGADVTGSTSNVYTYDGSSWSSISNQSGTPAAGEGFLIYVFSDDNNDGTDEGFPKTITLSGSEHDATVSVTTAESSWNFLGNPFTHTIDADKLSLGGSGNGTNDNYETVVYVWDNASGAFKSYDASIDSGTLTGGLIEPFQGFFIQSKSGGTQFDFKSSAKAASSGTFYKTPSYPNITFETVSRGKKDRAFLNIGQTGEFYSNGAVKLKPIDHRQRLLSFFYNASLPMEILNATISDTVVSIPFDVYMVDDSWALKPGRIELGWELNHIPDRLSIKLVDMETGIISDLKKTNSISVNDNVPYHSELNERDMGPIPIFRSPRFELKIIPNILLSANTSPSRFKLYPAYPNPFNTSTTIEFDLLIQSTVSLTLYDMMGRQVATLLDKFSSAGNRSVLWPADQATSGIYFCQIKAGPDIQTIKLVLIR